MPDYTIRKKTPAGLYLPEYMTISAGGWNTSIIGNSENGKGVTGANVLNNCVGYAQGRAIEVYNELHPGTIRSLATNKYHSLCCDAQNFLTAAQNADLPTGSSIREGSIIVYGSKSGGYGHVAFVEDRDEYNTWHISEGHWYHGGQYGSWDYMALGADLRPAWMGTDFYIKGYIYVADSVPKGDDQVNITMDVLKRGSSGQQVKTLQILLNYWMRSFDALVVDGSFGYYTEQRVKEYQHVQGLTIDGIVGLNTWSDLLKA